MRGALGTRWWIHAAGLLTAAALALAGAPALAQASKPAVQAKAKPPAFDDGT